MYDILSESDKEFAPTTKVEYAAHPYIWMSSAKSRSTGLGLESDGLELRASELPPVDESKILKLSMLWKNPVTGKFALQIHPSAVRKLHLKDGSVIDDLKEVRDIVYRLQRPGICCSRQATVLSNLSLRQRTKKAGPILGGCRRR